MNGFEITALAVVGLWVASGLVLFGAIVRHSGLPEIDAYDGWHIAWGETFSLIIACIIGAPFWAWLWWSERRADKATALSNQDSQSRGE